MTIFFFQSHMLELMDLFTVSIQKTVDCIIVYKKNFLSVMTNINYFTFTKNQGIFSLLSACTDKLLSTSEITTFLPYSLLGSKNCERASKTIPQPLYPYLSGSAFLVNFTAAKNSHLAAFLVNFTAAKNNQLV